MSVIKIKKSSRINVGAMTYAKLIKYLMDGTMSMRELAEATGLHYMTVQAYIAALHKEGVVHIAAWEQDSIKRHSIRIYMLGEGKDASKEVAGEKRLAADYRARERHKKMIQRMAA